MSLSDWSLVFFRRGDEDPTYLPFSFTTASGDTRYANNCTLDDITSAGYIGPIQDPPRPLGNQVVIWDKSKLDWVLVEGQSPDEDPYFITRKIISFIKEELELIYCNGLQHCTNYSSKFRDTLYAYRGKLIAILEGYARNPEQLIAWTDVPARPPILWITPELGHQQAEDYFKQNEVTLKTECARYGVVPVPDYLNCECFPPIPADWPVGSNPIGFLPVPGSYVLPSGYKLCYDMLPVSGYLYVGPI